jgi:hypothetical protein
VFVDKAKGWRYSCGMILLVSGATKTLRDLGRPDCLGQLLTPDTGNAVPGPEVFWAADNAAFSDFSPARFCTLLGRIAGKPGCLFVTAPDVVGNARETALRFYHWRPVIKALGLPIALVLQDGQEGQGVPWNLVDAVFIGGSTTFKLGPVAAGLAREAKERGLWVHGGRVNTRRRFRQMHDLGCDSIDGSGFSKWSEIRIPMALKWFDELDSQLSLPLAA